MTSRGATGLIVVPRTRHLVLSLATVLAVMLIGSSCTVAPSGQNQARTPSPAQKSAAQALPSDKETLARFYTQDLAWSKCGPNQCAKLTVPIDYSHPDGDTLKLAVLRAPATNPSDRIGSLVVNPGGPGGSGVDYASHADDGIVTTPVRAAYDIVGFDPRGVGSSSPIKCLNDRELDTFLGSCLLYTSDAADE